MRARDRRWTAVAAMGVVAAALGLGTSPGAVAQELDDPSSAFGGFTATGRGNGLQLTYNVENVFPIPAPLFQASVPEASASLQSGPAANALAASAYPGSLLANLPAVIAQSGPDGQQAAEFVPPYPLRAQAAHPSGPPDARQDVGTSIATAAATDRLAVAETTMGGGDLPPFVRIGAITTAGLSTIVDGMLQSRSRVELNGVELFFGLIHIESIVTDLIAATDGATAASEGTTVASGVTFLGYPATLGPDGLVVQPHDPEPSGPGGPVEEGAGGLAPALEGAGGALDPLNQALQDVLGTTNASATDLLTAAGINIRLFEPFESVEGAAAERTANGLVIEVNYDGSGDNPLAQLLAAIPSEDLPGEGIPGFPINTSPQAMVQLMKETHVTGLALAYGNVNVNASPAFEFDADLGGVGDVTGTGGGVGGGGLPTPAFSTPTPNLPAGGASAGGTGGAGTPAGALGGVGAGAAVVLALVTSPLWAVGSRKLADNVLGIAGSSCPEGLDSPIEGG